MASDFQPLGTHYFDDSHHYFSDAFLKGTNKRFMATTWLIQGEYLG